MNDLVIRRETPADNDAVRRVNNEAFGQPNEADLVEALRTRGALTLSLVAERDGIIVGHILFTPATIESEGSTIKTTTLAPMSVLPEYQNLGIGSDLVRSALAECRGLGHRAAFVLGHPDYYPRFGFVPSKSRYGIDCEFEVPDDVFMALELVPGALEGIRGTMKYQPEFRECT
ncbi:MAG TPA: N-acetyltransferase [Acidobacteriota bacterium]|nr:N-acetyltransferase [Acidobacteriota bacterium]